jgi:hypothetical protein
MVAPIIVPEMQFCDQNGTPLAGASITTYIMDTSTPKATWLDPQQSALQTNPAILDAAGRVRLYGDGDYRLVLKAADGSLIWDTPATTIVSAAMEPVVSAPTIADALNVLGVTGLIAAEATARSNADSAEQNARIAADNAITTAWMAGDSALADELNTEISDRAYGDSVLQSQINSLPPPITGAVTMQTGTSTSDSAGNISVTYPVAFTTQAMQFIAVVAGSPGVFFDEGSGGTSQPALASTVGRLVNDPASDGTLVPVPNTAFTWHVIGL